MYRQWNFIVKQTDYSDSVRVCLEKDMYGVWYVSTYRTRNGQESLEGKVNRFMTEGKARSHVMRILKKVTDLDWFSKEVTVEC